jgi:hypothetical protein
MFSAKRLRVITIETHRQMVMRQRGRSFLSWCETCGAQTRMVSPEEAAWLCGRSQRQLFRQIENGELHFTEASIGAVFLCLNSLSR